MKALDRFQQQRRDFVETAEQRLAPERTTLERVLAAKESTAVAQQYAEVNRIIALAIRFGMTEEEREAYTRATVLGQAFEEGFRLLPEQAEAVCEYELVRGLCGPIGVGRGKTLITLMIAGKAYSQFDHRKILLFVPAQVRAQLLKTDIPWARGKIPVPFPVHDLSGRAGPARRALAMSNKKGLYVMTYELLSSKDAYTLLEHLDPTLIIGDEAHRVANSSAARTRRLFSFLDRQRTKGKRIECCWLSGTMTSKSIRDYSHLIQSALGQGNPLPNSSHLVNAWATIIDSESSTREGVQQVADASVSEATAGPLMPLVNWARKHFPHEPIPDTVAGFRRAFRLRLNHAPGVVASGDAEIATSLIIANEEVEGYEECEGWEELDRLIRQVADEWTTPNGDAIDHAIHTWKWLNELCCGFYNELTWPTAEVYAKRKGIEVGEAETLLHKAKEHHAARQAYVSTLQKWLLEKHRPGLDTPFLVGQSMHHYGPDQVGHDLYEVWDYAKRLEFEGMPVRDSRVVRVCEFKIKAAVEWARKVPRDAGAIMWVHHQEVGEWLTEALLAAGLDALHCPAGSQGNELVVDQSKVGAIRVASIGAHGTGKNIQFLQHQYVVQWPRNAKVSEQMLGRLHRTGQKADEITCVTNHTLEHDRLQFAACLVDALYIHQSIGTRQKLIYANYDPLPKMFPPAVLHERGLEVSRLTPQQQRELSERFAS